MIKTLRYRIVFGGVLVVLCLLAISHGVFATDAIVVTPDNLNGWDFLQETATGSGTFVYGPYGPSMSNPPLGGGSAQLTVNSTGGEDLVTLFW